MLDKQAKAEWLNVCKALDNLPLSGIIEAWKEHSNTAKSAGLRFAKSLTEAGTSTPKSDSVPSPVLLSVSPKRSQAAAIIAELSSSAARPTPEATCSSARSLAENSTTGLSAPVTTAESSLESHEAMLSTVVSFAPCGVLDCQDEKDSGLTRVEEALKTWLGSSKSSRLVATAALCAALTDALKRTTFAESKTFQSFDTTRQTDFASATTATITESTAESLILSTVDTLRRKAIDKAAGAEREDLYPSPNRRASHESGKSWKQTSPDSMNYQITAPATDAAKTWDGWGTALKPASEHWILARKPLIGTVVDNVLEHGTGAINVDGCRIGADQISAHGGGINGAGRTYGMGAGIPALEAGANPHIGRWPANLVLDEEAAAMLDEMSGGAQERNRDKPRGVQVLGHEVLQRRRMVTVVRTADTTRRTPAALLASF